MPRPIRPWFRVYVEMFPDRKIRRLTPTQRWIWCAVMGAARESPTPPALFIAEGVPMTHQELADYAAVKLREIGPALALMGEMGMVTVDNGVIYASNFQARQFESDNVTDRTRAHRERSKEQRRNVPGNTPDARVTETETETEELQLISSTDVDGQRPGKPQKLTKDTDPRFVEFWTAYPKRVAKAEALKALAKVLAGGVPIEDVVKGAIRYRDDPKRDPEFTAHPASWLNAGRWTDETGTAPPGRRVNPFNELSRGNRP